MGFDFRAMAGFGYTVDLTTIEFEEQESNCDHTVRLGNKFCPECGQPVIDADEDGIDLYNIRDIFEETAERHGCVFANMSGDYDKHNAYFFGIADEVGEYDVGDPAYRADFSPDETKTTLASVLSLFEDALRKEWEDDTISLAGLTKKFGFYLIMGGG